MTSKSNKLIATTTELVDPNKIKQVDFVLNPNGQVQSINQGEFALTIQDKKLVVNMPDIAKIYL